MLVVWPKIQKLTKLLYIGQAEGCLRLPHQLPFAFVPPYFFCSSWPLLYFCLFVFGWKLLESLDCFEKLPLKFQLRAPNWNWNTWKCWEYHPPSSISSSISAIPRLTTRGLATESSPLQFSFSLLGTKCTITLALCIIMYSPADNSTLRGHLFSRDAKRKSAWKRIKT